MSVITTNKAEAAPVVTTPKQRALAAKVASTKVGAWYRWGATGPSTFDCSGLIDYAYRSAKRPLHARTTYQLANLGARISRKGLKPGDVVFTYDRSLGHAGIYLGANRYVHAPGRGRRVKISALPGGSAFVRAIRP